MRNKSIFLIALCFGGGLVNAVTAINIFMVGTDFNQFLWHAMAAVIAFCIGIFGIFHGQWK